MAPRGVVYLELDTVVPCVCDNHSTSLSLIMCGTTAYASVQRQCLSLQDINILGLACRWEAGNTNEWAALTYPDEVLPFVVAEFKRMKERQARLLGFQNGYHVQSKL